MKKRLVALLTAAVLVLAALPAALADGQIRILPVDMSGGAPYKETFRLYLRTFPGRSPRIFADSAAARHTPAAPPQ